MSNNIMVIAGSRPQLIKLAGLPFKYKLINTGQHYDNNMSKVFFDGMDIPKPDWNLNATTLGDMISKIIPIIQKEKPKIILILGDTRSTLAGATAACECGIKSGHIEAGVRSSINTYEERVRIAVDHMSDIRFCPTIKARENLKNEGLAVNSYVTGDILYDIYLENRGYNGRTLLTLHRQENVDDRKRLKNIFKDLDNEHNILFLCHPRTKKRLEEFKIKIPQSIIMKEPVGYREMQELIRTSSRIITDSGGIQREAAFAGVPCKVLREGSEWEDECQPFGDGGAGMKIYTLLKVIYSYG